VLPGHRRGCCPCEGDRLRGRTKPPHSSVLPALPSRSSPPPLPKWPLPPNNASDVHHFLNRNEMLELDKKCTGLMSAVSYSSSPAPTFFLGAVELEWWVPGPCRCSPHANCPRRVAAPGRAIAATGHSLRAKSAHPRRAAAQGLHAYPPAATQGLVPLPAVAAHGLNSPLHRAPHMAARPFGPSKLSLVCELPRRMTCIIGDGYCTLGIACTVYVRHSIVGNISDTDVFLVHILNPTRLSILRKNIVVLQHPHLTWTFFEEPPAPLPICSPSQFKSIVVLC
jgi:hypothetical protein